MLAQLNIGTGCRVATLAWNTQAHVEAWYGIMSMGVVCRTLNPHLTAAQLAAMVNQPGARVPIASADLLGLVRQLVDAASLVKHVLVIDETLAEVEKAGTSVP